MSCHVRTFPVFVAMSFLVPNLRTQTRMYCIFILEIFIIYIHFYRWLVKSGSVWLAFVLLRPIFQSSFWELSTQWVLYFLTLHCLRIENMTYSNGYILIYILTPACLAFLLWSFFSLTSWEWNAYFISSLFRLVSIFLRYLRLWIWNTDLTLFHKL